MAGAHDGPRDTDDQPAAVPRDAGPSRWSITPLMSRIASSGSRETWSLKHRGHKQPDPKVQQSPKRTKKKIKLFHKDMGINMNEKFVRDAQEWSIYQKYPESSSLLANLIFFHWFIFMIQGSTLPWCTMECMEYGICLVRSILTSVSAHTVHWNFYPTHPPHLWMYKTFFGK